MDCLRVLELGNKTGYLNDNSKIEEDEERLFFEEGLGFAGWRYN